VARLAVAADATAFVEALLPLLQPEVRSQEVRAAIADGRALVAEHWRSGSSARRVTPHAFFAALQRLAPAAIYSTDSGNGTFLAMEHLRLDHPGCFIGPIDYSCMGYSVPAAIGAKLANPDRDVVALAGDGALLMTGLEMLTASALGCAPLVCVLRDEELAQIAQFQRTSLNRDTCSVLAPYSVEALARAVNAAYLMVSTDADLDRTLAEGLEASRAGRPVMMEVAIDYSQKTYFTRGVVMTVVRRLPLGDRLRMIGRAAGRHLAGTLAVRPPGAER
jgi:acetolactate synthase-1/2/3 large subunit